MRLLHWMKNAALKYGLNMGPLQAKFPCNRDFFLFKQRSLDRDTSVFPGTPSTTTPLARPPRLGTALRKADVHIPHPSLLTVQVRGWLLAVL